MSEDILIANCLEQAGSLGSLWAVEKSWRRVQAWAGTSIRNRGLWTTLKVGFGAATDVFFDWRYGTDTFQEVKVEDLQTSSGNASHAVHYQATKARPFKQLLRRLQLPRDAVFVDFGSGKGRVLMLAAREQFKRVVGVEFSPRLCAIARRNVEAFRTHAHRLAPIEIVEGDATTGTLRGDENVFFFYNPFDGVILSQVVERIRQSLVAHPRPIWLIYCTPCHAEVIEQSAMFTGKEEFSFGGTEFRVYSNAKGAVPTSTGRLP